MPQPCTSYLPCCCSVGPSCGQGRWRTENRDLQLPKAQSSGRRLPMKLAAAVAELEGSCVQVSLEPHAAAGRGTGPTIAAHPILAVWLVRQACVTAGFCAVQLMLRAPLQCFPPVAACGAALALASCLTSCLTLGVMLFGFTILACEQGSVQAVLTMSHGEQSPWPLMFMSVKLQPDMNIRGRAGIGKQCPVSGWFSRGRHQETIFTFAGALRTLDSLA